MQTADVQNDVLNLDTYKRTLASNDASDIDNIQKGTFDYINKYIIWSWLGLAKVKIHINPLSTFIACTSTVRNYHVSKFVTVIWYETLPIYQ